MKPLLALSALALSLPVQGQEAPAGPSPGEVVASAPAADWVAIPAEELLVMDLAPDAAGTPRRVVIQLMPEPFSQGWVANIRTLARAHWFDGIAVVRVQDNYVVQWGDPHGEDAEKAKPLPEGLRVMREEDYVAHATVGDEGGIVLWHPKPALVDSYAVTASFAGGWPVGLDISGDTRTVSSWPVHCYGMVGVGRGLSPDTGTGAELYTVIGHAPRHLDRNIALVGRVIAGIEHLSSLPRGHGELGFYDAEQGDQIVPIRQVRLASELRETAPPGYEYLSTESESFAAYLHARANRQDAFTTSSIPRWARTLSHIYQTVCGFMGNSLPSSSSARRTGSMSASLLVSGMVLGLPDLAISGGIVRKWMVRSNPSADLIVRASTQLASHCRPSLRRHPVSRSHLRSRERRCHCCAGLLDGQLVDPSEHADLLALRKDTHGLALGLEWQSLMA